MTRRTWPDTVGNLPVRTRGFANGRVVVAQPVCPYPHATRGNIEVVLTVV